MKHIFKKGIFLLLGLGLTIACSSDDDPTALAPSANITNLSFTAVPSGDGTVITVTPTSTGGVAYSVNFGSTGSDNNVQSTAGPGVSFDYANEDATYTITVTAAADGATAVTATQSVAVDYTDPDPSPLWGTWVFSHTAAAMKVGPTVGSGEWFSNSLADLVTRDCLFDDQYIFNEDGTFTNVLGDNTWLEPSPHGVDPEACGAVQAPFDGSASGTWTHDEEAETLTLNGTGIFMGLHKVTNTGDLTAVADAAVSIIYNVVSLVDSNTLTLQIESGSGVWWTWVFAKEGSLAASNPTTDTDGDGVIDILDACPTVSGTETNGCPSGPSAGPTTPTKAASEVISYFSDAYVDETVVTWASQYSNNAVLEIVEIASDNLLKLSLSAAGGYALSDVAVKDVSAHNTLHADVWSATNASVDIKVVDYGANQQYGGDDDTEQLLTIDIAAGWNSIDKILSGTNTNFAQFVFTSASAGVVFIDNLYFHTTVAPADLILTVTASDPSATTAGITGPWWSWDPNNGPQAVSNVDGTWTVTISPAPTETMEFKWLLDGSQENLIDNAAAGECTARIDAGEIITDYSGYANRKWILGSGNKSYTFGTCD